MVKRTNAILYTCATCNLKCTYCYINKNKGLNQIDQLLADSFADPDYYFNFIKKYFPHSGDLETVEVWGGEPFMHIERIFPLIRKLVDQYPFFNSFFGSTNFSYPEWIDKIVALFNVLGEFPDRQFNLCLQLSLDGPAEITDLTRGEGTTEKCLQNFDLLLERAKELPANVRLTLQFKPTLSIDTIYLLNTKKAIIEYYQFFESLIDKVVQCEADRVWVNYPVPNLGVPVPATKEDGLYFAKLCQWCREIECENQQAGWLRYYNEITPFATDVRPKMEDTYNYPLFNCGTGSTHIGFLPNNLISSCHNGFVDLVEAYEKEFIKDPNSSIDQKLFQSTHNRFTHTEDDYKKYERQIEFFNQPKSLCRMGCVAGYIRTLALAGQIDEYYATEEGAFRGAELFQSCHCNCMRDNYQVTGSVTMPPEGMIIMLLNGAIEHIMGGFCKCQQ